MKKLRLLLWIAAIALGMTTTGTVLVAQTNPPGGTGTRPEGANPARNLPFRGPPDAENPRPDFPTGNPSGMTPGTGGMTPGAPKPGATPKAP